MHLVGVVGNPPKTTKISPKSAKMNIQKSQDSHNHSKWLLIALIFRYIVQEDFSNPTLKFCENPCMAMWLFEA